jgi:hypothetical protein
MPTTICFESDNESSAHESSEYLVERAGSQVDAREFLDVLYEGVAVLVAARETGEHKYGGGGVSPQSLY